MTVDKWQILRLNLDSGNVRSERVPERWQRLGGRALTSAVVAELVPPQCDPLGESNVLVLATGLLAGSGASSSTRLSLGAKSPLTGGIKESNVGGQAGYALTRLGVRCLIIEGSMPAGWCVVRLGPNGIALNDAQDLIGLDVYQTVAELRHRHGPGAAVLAIGPAGEIGLSAANIGVSDVDGIPARHAGRGGLGAVMGGKRVKAIVIDPSDSKPPQPANKKGLSAAVRRFAQALWSHPVTGESLPTFGTSGLINAINARGGLPTRNFRSGSFENAAQISGAALHDLILRRGGKPTHRCMPGCVVRCSNVLPDEGGEELTRGLEYESIALLGANCGIGDLDIIAKLNRRCDELGLDTIEIGVALGVAMEAGIADFGDAEAAAALLEEIGVGTPLGRTLGHGAAAVGRMFRHPRVPVVRGQAMAAYDPRALKGTGVTFATSPMGADHTAGNALPGSTLPDGTEPDPCQAEGQVMLSRYLQHLAAVFDLLGLCWFTRGPILGDHSLVTDLLEAQHGGRWSFEELFDLAQQTLDTEIAFNRDAGVTAVNDLPRFFRTEPLPPGNYTFDVPVEELASTLAGSESQAS